MRVHRRAEIGKVLAGWAVALVIVLLLLESVLRLAPSLIPISVLHRFTPSLRQEVASASTCPPHVPGPSSLPPSGATVGPISIC
jgi:hypothetical protein